MSHCGPILRSLHNCIVATSSNAFHNYCYVGSRGPRPALPVPFHPPQSMLKAAALAPRPPASVLLLWLLPLLLVPYAAPLRLCNSWNLYGSRLKLRDYPAQAGPIRITQGNFTDCYSLTLSFSLSSIGELDFGNVTRYFVLMDGQPPSIPISCNDYWNAELASLANLSSTDWGSILNINQPIERNYTYIEGWFSCCNSSDRCNVVQQPPSFSINATPTPITACNAFNTRGGYRFFSNPSAASPINTVLGNFSECYSYTVALVRDLKVLYYVNMDGYNPNIFDGKSSCGDWVNRTLRSLRSDAVFPIKFNLTMANAWGQCCNETSCNTVALPPDSSAWLLLPSPLCLGCTLVWAVMLIMYLASS